MIEVPLLAARGLTRYYGRQCALRDVDITLTRGEVLGFLGLNGAGKSTTMQILTGALAPHRGTVEIRGVRLDHDPLRAKAAIGYLPETPPLVPDMRVDEYLTWCAELHRVVPDAIADSVSSARARCGLADVGTRLLRHLSKGYQQRVGIAQAIVHDPEVVILDEPTSGLDPRQIRDVRALIRTLAEDRALVVSTHILPEARLLATRIAILHEGRVVYDAPATRGGVLRARFREAPAATDLLALDGVLGAQASAAGAWEIETEDGDSAALALSERAVREGWGLLELTPDDDRLERLFMHLTSGGSLQDDAA